MGPGLDLPGVVMPPTWDAAQPAKPLRVERADRPARAAIAAQLDARGPETLELFRSYSRKCPAPGMGCARPRRP